jgi:hypothetical protein
MSALGWVARTRRESSLILARRGNRCLCRREDEYLCKRLFRQAVMVRRRPVRDGGRIDQARGDLKLVGRRDAGDGRRERVAPRAYADYPSRLFQVAEGLADMALRQADGGGKLSSAGRREKAIPLAGEPPDMLDSRPCLDQIVSGYCSPRSNDSSCCPKILNKRFPVRQISVLSVLFRCKMPVRFQCVEFLR